MGRLLLMFGRGGGVGRREGIGWLAVNLMEVQIGRVLLSATVFQTLLLCRVSDFTCDSLLRYIRPLTWCRFAVTTHAGMAHARNVQMS